MHMTVRGGVRESTARAYLKPVMHRSNLKVITNALVRRVEFDEKRATGISLKTKSETKSSREQRER